MNSLLTISVLSSTATLSISFLANFSIIWVHNRYIVGNRLGHFLSGLMLSPHTSIAAGYSHRAWRVLSSTYSQMGQTLISRIFRLARFDLVVIMSWQHLYKNIWHYQEHSSSRSLSTLCSPSDVKRIPLDCNLFCLTPDGMLISSWSYHHL